MKSSFETQTVAPPDLLSDQKAGPLTGHGVENALARLEVDLSAQLFFQRQSLVLTPEGLGLWDTSASPHPCLAQWPLQAGLRLQHSDHAGAGSLELLDTQGRLAQWRFTLAHNPDALRLVDAFEQAMAPFRTPGKSLDESLIDEADQALAEEEAEAADTPPSTLGLLRLWRFAKPYQGHLLLGFLLYVMYARGVFESTQRLVLVAEDAEEQPWPRALRIGGGAKGMALLKDVTVIYEIWRRMNGFPPDFYKAMLKPEDKKSKKK